MCQNELGTGTEYGHLEVTVPCQQSRSSIKQVGCLDNTINTRVLKSAHNQVSSIASVALLEVYKLLASSPEYCHS